MGEVNLISIRSSDSISEQGHPELRQAMFEKNLFKVTDDPTRFCYAYISFLTEQGILVDLNKGFATIRKVFKKHVTLI